SFDDIELGMKGGAEAGLQVEITGCEGDENPLAMLLLDGFVEGLDDGFLAGEVVVGRAEGDAGVFRDLAHGGGIETNSPESHQRGVENAGSRFGRALVGDGFLEHVQIVEDSNSNVKQNLNMFMYKISVLLLVF